MSEEFKPASIEFVLEPPETVMVRGRGEGDDLFALWALASACLLDQIGMPLEKPLALIGAVGALLDAAHLKNGQSILIDLKQARKEAGGGNSSPPDHAATKEGGV